MNPETQNWPASDTLTGPVHITVFSPPDVAAPQFIGMRFEVLHPDIVVVNPS